MARFIRKITILLVCILGNAIPCKETSIFYAGIGENHDYRDINYKKDINSKPNGTNISITLPPVKRNKIERVSKRQYEIVNVIWRKTKIFLDIDTTTQKEISSIKDRLTPNTHQSNKHEFPNSISTPSCIEFYYSDRSEDQLQSKDNLSSNMKKELTAPKIKQSLQSDFVDTSKAKVLRRPIFTFHLNNRNLKEAKVNTENFYLDINEYKPFQSNESNKLHTMINTSEKISNKRIARNNNNDTKWLSIFFNDPLNRVNSPSKEESSSTSSTFYDRIRFFELYDNNTLATTSSDSKDEIQSRPDLTFPSEFVNTTPANKTRYNSIQRYAPRSLYNSESFLRTPTAIANRKRDVDNLNEDYNSHLSEKWPPNEITRRSIIRTEITMVWPKYPFLSVYIYEPMSIFCDAAAINSYWLIAAGSCLSRHRKTNVANGRSAYISYCGDKWWEFNSIAYVRRTLVHPLFNRRDKVRRHHYNIGAVQVITSMINSCSGLAAISLVSHNFTINEKGFPATAIGWGLDRYSSRHSYFNLPRRPLIAYEGTIFPKSCPQRTDYNEAQYEKELNIKNLYCLSLPYRGERKDTAHGTLLLVQGKLIALALQKGKSRGNEISVLYTGVWRLVPWILDLTRNTTKQNVKNMS